MLRTLGVISMANWFYVAGSLCFLIGSLCFLIGSLCFLIGTLINIFCKCP